jgi:hypothetical protein
MERSYLLLIGLSSREYFVKLFCSSISLVSAFAIAKEKATKLQLYTSEGLRKKFDKEPNTRNRNMRFTFQKHKQAVLVSQCLIPNFSQKKPFFWNDENLIQHFIVINNLLNIQLLIFSIVAMEFFKTLNVFFMIFFY